MLNFIVNCCKKSGIRAKDRISAYLDKKGIEYRFYSTECGGHAQNLARGLEQNGEKTIIAIGGDGMFHEVLNGLTDPSSVKLGFIPAGSGNDFAKCARLPLNPVKALKIILNGKLHAVDYILFANGTKCLNICGTGLDVEVLKTDLAIRRLKGKPNYLFALIRVLRKFNSYPLTVTHDGGTNDYECLMVGACNGTHFGGGMKLSPHSSLSSGKINLIIIKMVERRRIKFILPRFLTGKHIHMDFTEHYLTDHVRITSPAKYKLQLDGEIYSDMEFDCRIVPSGINMFTW